MRNRRRLVNWSGPQPRPCEEQLANAYPGVFELPPASDEPAAATEQKWAALLPDTDPVPLIWERNYHGEGREEPC